MKVYGLSYSFLSVGIAMLTGCGGSQPPIAPPGAITQTALTTHGKTFSYTGAKQTFVVPRGVTHITVVARGAGGDSCPRTGRGARIYAVIPVAAKERLDIYVGGSGGSPGGGFNGGGSSYGYGYGGGGGASDVRVRPGGLHDRILVAAGGGGEGGTYYGECLPSTSYGVGGGGGGLTGGNGQAGFPVRPGALGGGGFGGTQTQGGAGGSGGHGSFCYAPGDPGANGALGVGGLGGHWIYSGSYYGGPGGGGGGGYFGGGGGGGACANGFGDTGGGGGGGSSYTEPRATHVKYWGNWKNASGNGLVVFSW